MTHMENIDIKGNKYRLAEHTPLIKPSWAALISKMKDHPSAPIWNSHYGDRLTIEDLSVVNSFGDSLWKKRSPGQWAAGIPSPAIMEKMKLLLPEVPAFRTRPGAEYDLEKGWTEVPFMSREDLARRPGMFIPDGADIKRIVIFNTAGTTGHAIKVVQHPVGACSYEPMVDFVLRRHGLSPEWNDSMVATILVGAQNHTVTCATVVTSWGGAGFIKINLKSSEWPHAGAADEYSHAMNPFFLNGDPISFAEMLKQGISYRPKAIISTAVAMAAGLKKELREFYRCPVIDWYSSNETGPIAYTCPEDDGFHILPHDIYIEIAGPDGNPLPHGERGEIVITGGRNPFLPLLRYRMGDFGYIDISPCSCGDPMPRIRGLEGRIPVLLRKGDGSLINPVDISQSLKRFSYVQHRFIQRRDLSCELILRPVSMDSKPDEKLVISALENVLGGLPLTVMFDEGLGMDSRGGKVIPFVSEL